MDNTVEKAAEGSELEFAADFNLDPLVGIVMGQWRINMEHRQNEIDAELESCHNMRAAKYSSQKAAEIRATGGEEVYAPLAAMQSISGAASVSQVVLPAAERAWSIKPTPVPELPRESMMLIEQQIEAERQTVNPGAAQTGRREELIKAQRAKIEREAKYACEGMQRKIDDQLVASGFYTALQEFVEDFSTYPYAVMKRITVYEPALEWSGGRPKKKMVAKDLDQRVSPFDIYPSPGMTDVHDGPLIERLRLRNYELAKHRGVKGFFDDAIDRVLLGGKGDWLFAWNDANRNDTEDNEKLNSESDLYDVLRYWGQIDGKTLAGYGVKGVEDDEYYDTEIWVSGNEVIRVAKNPHPLDRRPYYKAVWRSVPGQFWGTSPPSQVRHLQDVCNASMRALVKNMGISAGPQIVVMVDMLPKGEESITSIYPLKVWQMVSKPGSSQAPITFFQPQSNARELIGVFQHYWELAGDVTGIYRWNYGADQGMQGAAQTMNGLSMLLENSNKVIRHAVTNLENGVIIPRIHDQFLINMEYSPDKSIKGDIDVVARGSSSLIEKAGIRQRRIELLTAINNTPESQIPGMDGIIAKARLAILSETAKDLDIASEKFPTDDEIDALIAQWQESMKNQQQPKDPRVEAAEIAYKSRIEDQRLEMQDREKQRQHTLKVEQLRLAGIQAQMEKSDQKTFGAEKAKMTADLLKMKQKDNQFAQEMEIKRQKGTGI